MAVKKSICCIIVKDKKILIARRNPAGQMGGRWEFPGGKVEEGDSEETAIIREMREEFSAQANVLKKITEGSFVHDEYEFLLEVYLVQLEHDGIQKKYTLTEHTDYKWVEYSKIPKDNFVDSDLSVYDKVGQFLISENLI